MKKFIILAGQKQSGKSTVARYLCEKHGFIELALANTLKDLSAAVLNFLYSSDLSYNNGHVRRWMDGTWEKENKGFNIYKSYNGITVKYIKNENDESNRSNENNDKFIDKYKDRNPNRSVTIRKILQGMGDITRNILGDDIWLNQLDKKIQNLQNNGDENIKIVISDVRRIEEYDYLIKKYGAYSIKLLRKGGQIDLHGTEQINFKCHEEIENNGSLETLYKRIDDIIIGNKKINNNLIL